METGTSRSLPLLCVCLTTTVQYSNCRRSSGNQIIIIEYQRIRLRSRSIDKSEVLSYFYEGKWLSEIVRKSVVRMVSYIIWGGEGKEQNSEKSVPLKGNIPSKNPRRYVFRGQKKIEIAKSGASGIRMLETAVDAVFDTQTGDIRDSGKRRAVLANNGRVRRHHLGNERIGSVSLRKEAMRKAQSSYSFREPEQC
jgi:hypothetical protein